MGAWLRAELAPMLRDVLSREAIVRRGLFDPDAVMRTIQEHEQQRADRTDHLLSLINLEIWCRMYLDGRSAAGVARGGPAARRCTRTPRPIRPSTGPSPRPGRPT